MQIISERHREYVDEYSLDFVYNGKNFNGGGFSFPCNKDGELLEEKNKHAMENYQWCISGEIYKEHPNAEFLGVRKQTYSHIEPAIGICENCGEEVYLVDSYCGATECECGQWYAIGGYAINPPEMWEEPIDYDY